MNNEYIIVNKTTIQKRIEELEKEYILLSNKSDRSLSDIEEEREIVSEQRALAKILSRSTPLIPENIKPLQELIDEGYDPYDSAHHLQVQRMLKVIQEYISNLKLDI